MRGLELDPGYFISPYDVPDGVRLLFTANRGYLIELRYLTVQEKIEFTGTELPGIHFGWAATRIAWSRWKSPPPMSSRSGERVESVLSKLASPRNFTNHRVARSVLRDYWSQLAEQVRELETGRLALACVPRRSFTLNRPRYLGRPSVRHRSRRRRRVRHTEHAVRLAAAGTERAGASPLSGPSKWTFTRGDLNRLMARIPNSNPASLPHAA